MSRLEYNIINYLQGTWILSFCFLENKFAIKQRVLVEFSLSQFIILYTMRVNKIYKPKYGQIALI